MNIRKEAERHGLTLDEAQGMGEAAAFSAGYEAVSDDIARAMAVLGEFSETGAEGDPMVDTLLGVIHEAHGILSRCAAPADDHIGDGKMGGQGDLISREAVRSIMKGATNALRNVSATGGGHLWGEIGGEADDALRALPAAAQGEPVARCQHCDDTGDVIRADGEWLGKCDCNASLRAEVERLRKIVKNLNAAWESCIVEREAAETRIAELEAERPALITAAYEDAARIAGERCAACGAREISGLVKEHVLRAALAALEQAKAGAVTDAARDVLAERKRQISAEGWTPEHDDQHNDGEIAGAAATYALSAADYIASVHYHRTWPWQNHWWKPTTPRRDLVKAGALILAEIERLDRAALTRPAQGGEGGAV